nr:MAG TPA: hypothetical protein [Caudoviricetes sp.]
MTLKEIYEQHHGKVACYKGEEIGAFLAGYCGDKYLILGFKDETGWIRKFTPNVVVDNGYVSYRIASADYVAWING